MPRRKGSAKSKRRKSSSQSRRRKWKLNMEEVVPKVAREVVERLGLSYAGVTWEDIQDIIEEIVSSIAEARSTKPSIESLVNNIVKGERQLRKAIAAKLVQREELTPEQLEFIVAYAPEIAGAAAPRLYRVAKRLGQDHIVDALRSLWLRYGKPTPVECPYCGFRAVTPLLECIVCGRTVEERDLKERIGFHRMLEELAETEPVAAIEAAGAGFVLYDGVRLLPPSARRPGGFYMELYLTREEKELLLERARRIIRG